jgi:hypothetical protein
VRVLYTTILLPGLRRTGAEVASQGFVDALRALGHDVTVLGYRRTGTEPPVAPGDVTVGDRHIETAGSGLRAAGWMASAMLTRRPYTTTKFVSRAYRDAVAVRLRHAPPDLVVVDHARMGWLVPRGGFPDAPFVLIAHNVEHRLYAGLAEAGGRRGPLHRREAARILEVERRLCGDAREVWTLTSADAEALGALGARTRSFGIPPVGVPAAPPAPSIDAAVLGGWHWESNAAGLRWLAGDVAPHLGGLVVDVGGASAEPIAGETAGLRVRGPVPDALAFLQSARVVAVPSVAGAGVQVKTLDAIASGRRVVATPTAMRGIDDPPPTVRVASAPADFAAALRDAAAAPDDRAASDAGRAWARARTARFRAELAGALAEVTG